MKDWIHFITLLMATIIVLIMISSLYGCTYIAKETLRATDIIMTDLKDKKEIANIFKPYVLSDSDVFGRDDLNQLIAKYEHVEKQHYKLWLTSLSIMLKMQNHSTFGKSKDLLEEFEEKSKIYVLTQNHKNVRDKIEADRVVIISGEPGSGKTTIAEQICLEYHLAGYEFVCVEDDISEADAVFNNQQKQIFYFDDFLGRNYLEAFTGNQESKICRFINRVTMCKNKVFVLTSRTNIFNQGNLLSDLFQQGKVSKHEYEVKIDQITHYDKAKILYNHIWFSRLKERYVEQLYHQERYKNIIYHKNYNPRLISYITDIDSHAISENEYWKYVLSTLDDPKGIWENLFNVQLSESCRALVVLVAFNNKAIHEEVLSNAFMRFMSSDRKVSTVSLGDDFYRDLKLLVGSMLSRTIYMDTFCKYDVFNPSVADFVLKKYSKQNDVITQAIRSLRTVSSLEGVLDLAKNGVIIKSFFDAILNSTIGDLLVSKPEEFSNSGDYILFLGLRANREDVSRKIVSIIGQVGFNIESILNIDNFLNFFGENMEKYGNGDVYVVIQKKLKRIVDQLWDYTDCNLALKIAGNISEDCYDEIYSTLKTSVVEYWKEDITSLSLSDGLFGFDDIYWSDPEGYYGVLHGWEGKIKDLVSDVLGEYDIDFDESEYDEILSGFDEEKVLDNLLQDEPYDRERYYENKYGLSAVSSTQSLDSDIDDLFKK